MTSAAAGRPAPGSVPDWSTRLRGLGVWLLLGTTILVTSFLIQHFFADDVLHRRARTADLIQTAELLIGQGGHAQVTRAVRTLESVLKDEPLNPDALLLLEQARQSAPDGTDANELAGSLMLKARDALEAAVGKSATDAESRFLLARIRKVSPEAAVREKGEALLAEARKLAEADVKARPNDPAAAFLLARILRSKTPTDAETYREAAKLIRLSGRPEAELRLGTVARVPLATSLERIRAALDKGLLQEARNTLTAAVTEDRNNPEVRLLWAEIDMWNRPDSDRREEGDERLRTLLTPACERPDAPARARMYLAALEAMGDPDKSDKAPARALYEKAAATAGYDLLADAEALIARKRFGNARLLLAAENLLGDPAGKRFAQAALRRAELTLQAEGEDLPPASAAERLKAVEPSANVPPRALAYLAALEPDAKAKDRWAAAVAKGFDVLADVEALGKAEMFVAARWLLKAGAGQGLALSGSPPDPAAAERDSELWYQYGRTYAAGGAARFETAVQYYNKAVEVGRAAKTKGAGKAALSVARVYSNMPDPDRLKEAAEMVALARACGVEKMDITSADKIMANIEKARARPTGGKIAPH